MMRILTTCGAAALLFLPACSSEKPAPSTGGNAANASDKQEPTKTPSKRPPPPVRLDMVLINALFKNDPSAPQAESPSTPEKVALGRLLYHEKRLSKHGDVSCATCHDLANYGQDNKPVSTGTGGQLGERNTPTTWNAARNYKQLWDYRADSVEEQSILPVLNPIEHGLADEAEVAAKIKAVPELVAAFEKAFGAGDVVTAANFKIAIGAFERTLVTTSRWDKFLDGDKNALSNDEKRGLKTFIDVTCHTCHMTRLLGGSMPQKMGVYVPYATEDTGRHRVTGNDVEKFFFKVPSLLNVAKTAPYNHDGKRESLPVAVKQMARLQLNKDITDEQVESIVTFLNALTGELPADIVGQK